MVRLDASPPPCAAAELTHAGCGGGLVCVCVWLSVSTDLGTEVHSMSMSMSMAGAQGGLMKELEALEEIDHLRAENSAMQVVMKQMASELGEIECIEEKIF